MEKRQLVDDDLRLMVFKSASELGCKVDHHLLDYYGLNKEENTFITPITQNYFEDGHLKVQINETVWGVIIEGVQYERKFCSFGYSYYSNR